MNFRPEEREREFVKQKTRHFQIRKSNFMYFKISEKLFSRGITSKGIIVIFGISKIGESTNNFD